MRRLAPGVSAAAAAVALLVGACSSGSGDAALSLDDLRDAGDECPVDLAGSDLVVDQVGPVEVAVTEGTGEGELDDAAIDQAGGVYVECRVGGDDGTLAAVYASEEPGALGLLLPLLALDRGLTSVELEVVMAAYDDTDDGDLVELSAEGPVAVARLDVEGAESAVLYVSTNGATPVDVHAATEQLVDDL